MRLSWAYLGWVSTAAGLALLAVATSTCGGGENITVPTSGTLEVTTATSGASPDANGYTLQIDGGSPQHIDATGTFRRNDLEPGDHAVTLGDIAANCAISGDNPRSLSIVAGQTTAVSFAVTCDAGSGSIQIFSNTNGSLPDPDGYTIMLDGADAGSIGASGTLTLTGLAAGAHSVELSGIAANCQVDGENRQSVSVIAGATVVVAYVIDCQATPESELGQWTPPFDWGAPGARVVGVHLHLLPNGRVLTFGLKGVPEVWDQSANSFTMLNTTTKLVCSGHAYLPDGKLMITGGHIDHDRGLPDVNIFSTTAQTFTRITSMAQGRWYPTTTTLANGEMLTVGGADENTVMVGVPEVWTGSAWRKLSGANLAVPYYPWMFVAPNGKVFYAGWNRVSRYLDTQGSGVWTDVGSSNFGDREAGTAVMYEPGKVLIIGGGGGRLVPGAAPTATAEIIDLNSTSPAWHFTGSMAFARRHLNATLLPTGDVLVVGGTNGTGFNNAAGSVHAAEIWNPTTGTWKTVASNSINRIYHSTAILLPDARVLVAGAGENFEPETRTQDVDQFNAEIYSPPYLFRGPRPSISSTPVNLTYGSSFTLGTPDAASIAKVTIVRLSSVTHSFNQNQRFMALSFQATPAGVQVSAPASRNLAPPGHYLLFLVNSAGVPSVGRVVNFQ